MGYISTYNIYIYLENQVAGKKGALTKVEVLGATFTKVAVPENAEIYHLNHSVSNLTLFTFFLHLLASETRQHYTTVWC